MVELRDVHMRFEDKKVLDGVSLKVEPRERLVIMGQSGSGRALGWPGSSHCFGDRRINYQPKREIEGHIHYRNPRNGQRLSHRHANGYVVPGSNH